MSRPAGAAIVSGVRPGSLAEAAGIRPGDRLIAVGGRPPRDVVDLQFYQAEPEVEVVIAKPDGAEDRIVFEKDVDEDLGLEFDRATWDDVTLCNNNCFFCFLKGLPRGMRRTLYVKDDDYRLSFLHGNFVTLTNLQESDWARLAEQRLSPLNVSVHATDPDLRRRMLGNPGAPDVVEQIRRLGDLGIRLHTQIVLCPGVNDGTHLDRTLDDLCALVPTVLTVSVVPVGASPRLEDWSANRDGIELLRPEPTFARALIAQVHARQRQCRRRFGATIIQCSDEYYLTAGTSVPSARAYDGFPQYENGVGMIRRLEDNWSRLRRRLWASPTPFLGRKAVIGTGTLAAPVLARMADEFAALTGAEVSVTGITNTVFGDRVNVSGLLCGDDFIKTLGNGASLPDLFILPRASLDYFGTRFLDDASIEDVERALGAPVVFASRWTEVARALAGEVGRPAQNRAPNGAFWSAGAAESNSHVAANGTRSR